ncbi:damage-control phosphatase ARMT1 family protein, partial [bacterium]|nr:damage-control phosphatase ARMT1 family protein [bacterium]
MRLWLGFFGEGRKVIDFSAIESFNEQEFLRNYPGAKKAVEEMRKSPEEAQYFFDEFLARQMSFAGGAVFLFRRLKALSPENLIKFLYLISQISRLAKETTGHTVEITNTVTADPKEEAERLNRKLEELTVKGIRDAFAKKGVTLDDISGKFGIAIGLTDEGKTLIVHAERATPTIGKGMTREDDAVGRSPGRFGKGRFGPRALPGSANVEFLEKIAEAVKRLVKAIGRSVRLSQKERDISGATELNITLQKMLVKLSEKGKIDLQGKTFGQLTKKDIRRLEVQVAELVMFPREVKGWEISELFDERVSGELFSLSEAKDNPAYLEVSRDFDYREWVKGMVWRILTEIYREKGESLNLELVEDVTENVINALEFRLANGKRVNEIVSNQMLRELSGRIIAILLEGDPEFIFYTFRKLKELGRKVSLEIMEKEKDLDLHAELKRSILAGLIGVEMKSPVTGEAVHVETNAIPLDLGKSVEWTVRTVRERLAEMMKKDLAIDFWREYREEVLERLSPVSLVFFTDDYIETIFELKEIERELEHNEYLTVHLVPRAQYYGNDASYEDIMELMNEKEFEKLKSFYEQGRFTVCNKGPHMASFYKETISEEVAELLRRSDVIRVKGARAYETMQGIKKPAYFSMAVCRELSEAVTGVDERSGAPIFVHQDPGVPSFADFRYRAERIHIFEDGKVAGLARMTAMDYAKAVRSDAYAKLVEAFGNDRARANRWIMKNTFKYGTTFAGEVFAERLPIIRKEPAYLKSMSWTMIGGGVAFMVAGGILTGAIIAVAGVLLRVCPWVYHFVMWRLSLRIAKEAEPELVKHAREALLELATILQPDSVKKIFGIGDLTEMPGDAKDIEEKVTREIERPLRRFLRAIALLTKRPLSKEDQANIELTLSHIVGVLISFLQIYNAEYTKEPSRQIRLERLSEFDVSRDQEGKPGAR